MWFIWVRQKRLIKGNNYNIKIASVSRPKLSYFKGVFLQPLSLYSSLFSNGFTFTFKIRINNTTHTATDAISAIG